MRKDEYKNIEFLNKLANMLSKSISPLTTLSSLNKLFKTYLSVENAELIVWDNNNFQLQDFIQDYKESCEGEVCGAIGTLYSNLSLAGGKLFYLNDCEYTCELSDEEVSYVSDSIMEENRLIYPLVSNGEVFGLINILIKKENLKEEFFSLLNIASKLVSGAIINYILNEQMEVSLNFYKAMKDIAKIIESQYELSYIIPLVGEMIDRFMSSHLIYIFIHKENKYNLVWPNACKDEEVYKLLDRINLKTEYILSEDSKIGVFPIESEDKLLGAIVAYSNIEKLRQKDVDYLVQLTRQSGLTIQRANAYADVLKHATMDALTGLNNRRQFEIRLKQEVSNSKRNNLPLCSMMLDVDYFKKVNDTYGHAAGDCILKQVSQIIQNEIREYDIACRYGGEEFFIILPQTGIKEASLVAQRLRKVIEESKMDINEAGVAGVSSINVTVSVGVCEYFSSMSANVFVQKADKALYKAKTTGRNRVIVA